MKHFCYEGRYEIYQVTEPVDFGVMFSNKYFLIYKVRNIEHNNQTKKSWKGPSYCSGG
jgi:hypothetical protein